MPGIEPRTFPHPPVSLPGSAHRPSAHSTIGRFDHSPAVLRFWRQLARLAAARSPTPFYIFSAEPVRAALKELASLQAGVALPIRHWLSCKTQPWGPLLRWWRRAGHGIEVVSEFEYRAARTEGFPADRILVNGPAKHHWLPDHAVRGLRVNFDSMSEVRLLLPLAKSLGWSAGIRCLTSEEHNPESRTDPTQFGLAPMEAAAAIRLLQAAGVRLETIHFHLRTNVSSPVIYARAIDEVWAICRAADFQPRHLDCGGGWPPAGVRSARGHPLAAGFKRGLAAVYRRAVARFSGLEEIWLENGRSLLAGSGILAVRVLDVKERRGVRQLICDGGRTGQALLSSWEIHELLPARPQAGPRTLTTVHGPTCMAYDRLARCDLPRSIRADDLLIWMDAGAYHLPWETHFSHGQAAVFWHERGRRLVRARPAESFDTWWQRWAGRRVSRGTANAAGRSRRRPRGRGTAQPRVRVRARKPGSVR